MSSRQTEFTAIELLDALRISNALLTMRIGVRALDGIDWRRKYGARFRAALREIQGHIVHGEGRQNPVIDDLVQLSDRDEWAAVKDAERIIELYLIK